MKRACSLLLIAAVAGGMQTTRATTVIPPSFDQLVGQAETIFQGNVTDVRSMWIGEGADRHIETYITFAVDEALKGDPGQSYTLRMFGGTVADQSMAISDAPQFKVGDRDILFVENNGSQVIPLVGIMYGRFHVQKDQSGQDIVTRNEGEPVKNVANLGRDMEAPNSANPTEPSMTADVFKAAVKSKLQAAQ
jgi:hypothetical protein